MVTVAGVSLPSTRTGSKLLPGPLSLNPGQTNRSILKANSGCWSLSGRLPVHHNGGAVIRQACLFQNKADKLFASIPDFLRA